MSCTQSFNGILSNCTPSMGGIVKAWIANHDEGVLTTNGSSVDDPGTFFEFVVRRESSSMTSTITADPKTHTRYVTTEVTLVFPHMDEDKRLELEKVIAADMAVVVKDANGKYWYLGKDNPVNVSAGTGQTGTAAGDSNNYTITLQDVSHSLPVAIVDFE